jgi:CheY-like chemotaxis protein
MEGTIKVTSDVGTGSCFTITLNNVEILSHKSIIAAEENNDVLAPIHFQPAQILLVDDIEINRQLITSYLAEFIELTLIEAETGKQALNLVSQQHFDLILMDRRLPDINGDNVCQMIKTLPDYTDTPIIMITASVLKTSEPQTAFYDIQLNKPVNKMELLLAMQNFLPVAESYKPPQQVLGMTKDVDNSVYTEQWQTLIELLISQYQEKITQLSMSDGFNISEMIEIAEQLLELTQQYPCKPLEDWATTLKIQTQLFDITNLSKTLQRFDSVIKQLCHQSLIKITQ